MSMVPGSIAYILVLNWNGWRDTLACLESLLRSDDPAFRIVVWDNGSSDDSVTRIGEWARGELEVSCDVPAELRDYVQPPVAKPVDLRLLDEHQLADDGNSRVLLVRGARNLGYAGGNNAMMRWALGRKDCGAVWILNNDVVVARDTLTSIRVAHADDGFDRPVGSWIYHMDAPSQLQVCGGQRLGIGTLVSPRHAKRPQDIDFLVGASLFLSRARAQALGSFNEAYFLNAEDLELTYGYALRFRRQHKTVAPFLVAGRLWHRESTTQSRNRYLHAYYYTRNLLYAAHKIGPLHGWTTYAHALARLVLATVRGRGEARRGIRQGMRAWRAGELGPHP
jgi:GT2 family glycosyltransferase